MISKGRQHNDQKKNITHKTKDRATQNPTKNWE